MFCKEKIFRAVILILLFTIFTLFSAISYVNAVSSDIADGVFRLHVIANSDSVEDQNLKYKVRDALLEYMNSICADASSKEDAMNIASEHLDDFRKIAQKVVYDNNYNYHVTVEIGQYNFPTKHYGDVSLPSGIYDALRVKIGTASGQNWWCVMFPPLCFVDEQNNVIDKETDEKLKKVLTKDEYELIVEKDKKNINNLQIKFKIVEVFQKILNLEKEDKISINN